MPTTQFSSQDAFGSSSSLRIALASSDSSEPSPLVPSCSRRYNSKRRATPQPSRAPSTREESDSSHQLTTTEQSPCAQSALHNGCGHPLAHVRGRHVRCWNPYPRKRCHAVSVSDDLAASQASISLKVAKDEFARYLDVQMRSLGFCRLVASTTRTGLPGHRRLRRDHLCPRANRQHANQSRCSSRRLTRRSRDRFCLLLQRGRFICELLAPFGLPPSACLGWKHPRCLHWLRRKSDQGTSANPASCSFSSVSP